MSRGAAIERRRRTHWPAWTLLAPVALLVAACGTVDTSVHDGTAAGIGTEIARLDTRDAVATTDDAARRGAATPSSRTTDRAFEAAGALPGSPGPGATGTVAPSTVPLGDRSAGSEPRRPPDPGPAQALTAQLLASEISCMVDRLGSDPRSTSGAQLPELSSDPEDPFEGWNAAERELVADTMLACVDVARLTASQLATKLPLRQATLDCISTQLAHDGTLGEVLRAQLTGTVDAASARARLVVPAGLAFGRCASADELAAIANR